MALLEVRDLSVFAQDKRILDRVTLDIDKGQTVVLMGPNGAGKSTLSFALMGDPSFSIASGSITIDGKDITRAKADLRAKAGLFLSFQEPEELSGISMESFIRAAIQESRGERVKLFAFQKELKERMALLEMGESYATRDMNVGFSGGEKKKAEVLQLLMLRPKLAILDETDSGLDVDAVRVVTKGLKTYIKECQGTLFIITHNMRMIEGLCVDKTLVMVNGTIVKEGDRALIDYINQKGFDDFIFHKGSEV